MTHKMLVRKAGAWLRQNHSCTIVATELKTYAGEEPDALGFSSSRGSSILVEVKMSRSDFLADKKKYFRKISEAGLGDLRYFMAPKGLIKPDEVGEWGLVEISQGPSKFLFSRVKKESDAFQADKRKEVIFLTSILRRLEISSCVFVQQECAMGSPTVDQEKPE